METTTITPTNSRTKKKRPKIKTYRVNIDMNWSKDYVVKGRTTGEAKRKAWKRFKKSCPKNLFELIADREDY